MHPGFDNKRSFDGLGIGVQASDEKEKYDKNVLQS
jgi:hypothetical protein